MYSLFVLDVILWYIVYPSARQPPLDFGRDVASLTSCCPCNMHLKLFVSTPLGSFSETWSMLEDMRIYLGYNFSEILPQSAFDCNLSWQTRLSMPKSLSCRSFWVVHNELLHWEVSQTLLVPLKSWTYSELWCVFHFELISVHSSTTRDKEVSAVRPSCS